MLTADRITTDAQQIAKVRRFDAQALDAINAVLSDLCQTADLALARGQFNFNFDPGLTGSLFGSGPYHLPLDYLRTSGSSGARGVTRSAWYLYPAPAFPAGQPIFMTPIDLAEFDLFAKLPSQSTPELWCTDMGGPLTQRIILATPAAITANGATMVPASAVGLYSGLGVAGEGIEPGTTMTGIAPFTVTSIGTTASTTTVTGITAPDWAQLLPGDGVAASDIMPGTIIAALGGPGMITLSAAALASNIGEPMVFSSSRVTLSQPATITMLAASVYFGIAPVAYVYPPPGGNYPVTVRYQRMMPPLIDLAQYPWFPNDGYLIDKTAARLMAFSDDARAQVWDMKADKELGRYLGLSDDKTNRAQQVQLDGRMFRQGGPGGRGLKDTKSQGWG